jgi:multicomponent Na+:H+ antiporter subunit E
MRGCEKGGKGKKMSAGKGFGIVVTFCAMFLFWLLLSGYVITEQGKLDYFHVGAGVISSAIVALISNDLLVKEKGEKVLSKTFKFLIYLVWELWQIILANFDVAYRVLHPKMPIDPLIIDFETPLRSDFALVTLANSITLTPGTITISVDPEKGAFLVHAIAKKPADALLVDKTMQKKVAEVYMVG